MGQAFVSHGREDETPEVKARRFQSLTVAERVDVFRAFTESILANNPGIVEKRDVRPVTGRVRILSLS